MSVILFTLILANITCLFTVCTSMLITWKKRRLHTDTQKTRTRAVILLAPLCGLCMILSLGISLANAKGMESDATMKEFAEGFFKSPYETKLPDDFTELAGKLVVYYRYDCSLCHDEMKNIQTALKDYPVYYVCTRSEQGKALRELYPIDAVPSIVYICNDPVSVHYSSPLAIRDGDSGVMLNQSGLDRILEFYEKQY